MKKYTLLITFLVMASMAIAGKQQEPACHKETHWNLEPSLKYDFFCLLNTLTADPYYLKYYEAEFQEITARFTPPPHVLAALERLKRQIKDENKGIISAYLCLVYSATEATSLRALHAVTQDPAQLKASFEESQYYSEKKWALFERIRPDLLIIMDYFIAQDYEGYYRSTYLPKVEAKIRQIEKDFPKYNIIPTIEEHLGFPLASDTITVYTLYFSQPHGIKIIGTRFLTDIHWPFEVVFRNAVHEMMHPPFAPKSRKIKSIVNALQQDSLWAAAFRSRNTGNGYNSYEGLFEEGAVQALENHINHKFGMGRDVASYWAKQDGGIHVMAVCLYVALQEWEFSRKNNYTKFLKHFHKEVARHEGMIHFYKKLYPSQVK